MTTVSLDSFKVAQSDTSMRACRRVLLWHVGGTAQSAATAVALDLARGPGSCLTGLSPPGHRDTDDLRDAARSAGVALQLAGEWPDAGGLPHAMLGHDLIVAPAGVELDGAPAGPADELASQLLAAHPVPIIRVARRPTAVRRLLFVVGSGTACAKLAPTFLRLGLWGSASATILPVGDHRPGVRAAADAQAQLLHAHGMRVVMEPSLDLLFDRERFARFAAGFDAAVMGCLSGRRESLFAAARDCAQEEAARACPLVVLP